MVARQDQTTDPALIEGLLQARRGTALFARKLNELTDSDLDSPSLLPGWTRRHVVAHVGYNARAIARLVEWAATGIETPMYPSLAARNEEIAFGSTLSPIALRNLYDHSAVHLSVEWRDLPEASWHNKVKTIQGREVPAIETVWMRTREVWTHAVDLDNGATFEEIPTPVLERLLKDIVGAWRARGSETGLLIRVSEQPLDLELGDAASEQPLQISGPLASVVRWATGRGTSNVTARQHNETLPEVPPAPKWI